MRIRALIFDLDGTIADSIDLFYGFARDVAADLGLPPPEREAVLSIMRTGRSTFYNLVPQTIPREQVAAAFDRRGPDWLRRYHDETQPVPGSVEALRALHAAGQRLGIATSSGRDVPFLERWGVRELFTAIVGREDVERRKPAPDVVLQCLERIGLSPEGVIYVGDSPIDVQAGRAAGVATVGVLTGTSSRAVLAAERPDAIVPSIVALADLVASWS